MEKEQILSTLTEKVGKTSFSAQTLEAYVDLNPLAEGAEPDDAYWDKAVKFINKMQGQYNADVAKQVNEAKEKLKPQPKGGEDNDKRYSALEEKFDKLMSAHEKLTEQLANKESQQTQERLMSQVKAEMKKQGATDDYVLTQTLKGVTLDTKKSVADLTKEMLTAYDSEYTACRGKGAAPRNGENGGGSKGKTVADAFFANKQKKEGWGNAQKK